MTGEANQILPCFRVMICDQFVDIHATTEDIAKAILLQRIKDGSHNLSLIAWQDDGEDNRPASAPDHAGAVASGKPLVDNSAAGER